MSILVVGASGGIGGAVVEELAARGESVRASSRHPERLSLPQGVEAVRVDLDSPETLTAALDGVERVFLYADAGDPDALVDVLRQSGVRHVVLLSSHTAARPDAATDFNGARFYRAERAIRASGLQWTFLRPGGFCGNALRWRWEVARGSVAFAYPESASAPVHEQDIADVAVCALTSDDLVGQSPSLSGPQVLTLREQVQAIGAAVGREIAVVTVSDEQARASLARHVPQEWADYLVGRQREGVEHPEVVSDEYQRITGRAPRAFAQWAAEHADAFRIPPTPPQA